MESKVGRMGSSFYTLIHEEQRLAYVWERRLHTDMPNAPERQRLEFYEFWNKVLWETMFYDCKTVAERVVRFQEYVADGDITLQRLSKVTSNHKVNVRVFDGEQIVIETPSLSDLTEIGDTGMQFPKSLAWSNLVVKNHYRLATTYKKETVQ